MNRNKQIVKLGIEGIIVNLILVAFKLTMGFISGSLAIILDGINNLGDAIGSIITIIGTKFSEKKPDKDHPYGYGRIEYFASVLIAAIILYTGFKALEESIGKILHPEAITFSYMIVIVLLAAIAVKFIFGTYLKRRGKKLNAQAISAAGSDAVMDSFVSTATLISIFVYLFLHLNIDGYLGAAISLLILKTGFDILKEALGSIIGKRTDSELVEKIEKAVDSFPEVEGAYDLILHDYGPDDMIGSIHIEVNDKMTAQEIDALSRKITAKIYREFGILLTIGIYATNTTSPRLVQIKKHVREIVENTPYVLQMHGFYVDDPDEYISFDIVMDFKAEDTAATVREIKSKLEKEYPEFKFHINKDNDYSD